MNGTGPFMGSLMEKMLTIDLSSLDGRQWAIEIQILIFFQNFQSTNTLHLENRLKCICDIFYGSLFDEFLTL